MPLLRKRQFGLSSAMRRTAGVVIAVSKFEAMREGVRDTPHSVERSLERDIDDGVGSVAFDVLLICSMGRSSSASSATMDLRWALSC